MESTLMLYTQLVDGCRRAFFHATLSVDSSLGYEIEQLKVRTWARSVIDETRSHVQVETFPTPAQIRGGNRLTREQLIEQAYEMSQSWHLGLYKSPKASESPL